MKKPYLELSWEEQCQELKQITSCDDKYSYITVCVGCLNRKILDIIHSSALQGDKE